MDIDINFNFYSDTPKGKDPDTNSDTLRKYHQFLWSKPLPNGSIFNLDIKTPKILHHKVMIFCAKQVTRTAKHNSEQVTLTELDVVLNEQPITTRRLKSK